MKKLLNVLVFSLLFKLTLFPFVIASESKLASQTRMTLDDPFSGEHFSSDLITQKGDALPFKSYEAWLDDVVSNVNTIRGVDLLTEELNPFEFDKWKPEVETQWIEYKSSGLDISGVMLLPKSFNKSSKLPVIIYNRGGNSKTPLTRLFIAKFLVPIAAKGYIILASNYRGTRFSQGKDQFGGDDVEDVTSLVNIVETIPMADSNRIAMIGFSRGGMMTFQALRSNNSKVKVAIVIAGVSNHFHQLDLRPEMENEIFKNYIPNFEENREQELAKRSSIFWADELDKKVPLLLLHGSLDKRVDISNSRELIKKLNELGHESQLIEYPYGNHSLTFYQEEVRSDILAWLEKFL